MKKLYREGKTIIMASHLLDEVEKVCTDVAILKRGELIVSGKVSEILSNEDMVEVAATDHKRLLEILERMNEKTRIIDENSVVKIFFSVGKADLSAVNNYCFNNGVTLNHLVLKKQSLEARFFELTNN
ncbi:MAG: ABC transporter ATP-binding protein, partial [Ginsengibacter sp.]